MVAVLGRLLLGVGRSFCGLGVGKNWKRRRDVCVFGCVSHRELGIALGAGVPTNLRPPHWAARALDLSWGGRQQDGVSSCCRPPRPFCAHTQVFCSSGQARRRRRRGICSFSSRKRGRVPLHLRPLAFLGVVCLHRSTPHPTASLLLQRASLLAEALLTTS